MGSDDDSDLESLASSFSGAGSTLFTPFTPLLTLRDSKSQTTLSLLSSMISTVTSLGIPYKAIHEETSVNIGEGATYCVEKALIGTSKNPPLAAVKRTKFTIPKAIQKTYTEDPSLRRRVRSVLLELQVLSHPFLKDHQNFVHLLGYSWEESTTGYAPAIIVDLAEFGSLDSFATSGLSWKDKRILCDDIAVGLDALHSCGIAHGDMKPDNILVSKHPERGFIAKISDFEHALLGTDVLKYGGTPIYNAPEVHLQDHPSQQLLIPLVNFPLCDAFSFGLSVFEVFCDGKRYYENENTRSFRDLLMSFDHDKDELLDLALGFLKIQGLHPDLLRICEEIFQETLCFRPTDRLRGGWSQIRGIIGAETLFLPAMNSDKRLPQPLKPLEVQDSSVSENFIKMLSLYRNIMMDGDTVRSEIVAELRYQSAQSMLPSEERAKASFQLSVCSSIGFGQGSNVQESVDWLLQAALHGHEPSLIIGTRIMNANNLPIPDVLLYSPLPEETRNSVNLLEALAPEDYYSNAVRIFWGRELQKLALEAFDVEGDMISVSKREDFLDWFNTQHKSGNPKTLGEFIDRHFLLHRAAAIGDIEISRLLIGDGGNINLVNSEGQTPLYVGCRGGHASVVKMLLSKEADPSLCDIRCITPLHWIVFFLATEVYEIATLLVSHGANPDSAASNNLGIYFDQLGLSLRGSPLHWACLCRNQVAMRALFSLRFDPNPAFARQLISDALSMLSADIAGMLISTGDSLSTISKNFPKEAYGMIGADRQNNFKRWIVHGGNYKQAYTSCVDLLLQHGIPVNNSLLLAAKELNVYLAEALIDRGADVCVRDPETGRTPLHGVLVHFVDRFRLSSVIEMVKLLLQKGATLERDPEYRYLGGNLLMISCVYECPVELIRVLLSHGGRALVNSRDSGSTPLHRCHSDPRVTKLLLEFGANPNVEKLNHENQNEREHDMEPWNCCLTPAGQALSEQMWEILEVLLDYGTTLMVGSTGGHQQTLLHLAVIRHYYWIYPPKINHRTLGKAAKFLEVFLDHPAIQEAKLINAPDWMGFTPLKYAIWFAMPRCTEILLSRGAKVDDTSTITPRMVVGEFYKNPPYFVHDDDTHIYGSNRWDYVYGQSKSEYRIKLKKITSILDADSKTLRLVSNLEISGPSN